MFISPYSKFQSTNQIAPSSAAAPLSVCTSQTVKNNLINLITERIKQHNNIYKNISELCLDQICFHYSQIQNIKQAEVSNCVQLQKDAVTIIQKCERVKHLSMSNCRLYNLRGFPKLEHLQFLDLSNNQLSEDSYQELEKFPNLIGLNLDDNNFSNLQKIKEFLNKMKNLKQISLITNKFEDTYSLFPSFSTQEHELAKQLFANCQSLQFVNGIDRNGCDRVSDNQSLSSSSSQQNLQMDNIPQQEQEEFNQNQNDDEDQSGSGKSQNQKNQQNPSQIDDNQNNSSSYSDSAGFQQKVQQPSEKKQSMKQQSMYSIQQKRERFFIQQDMEKQQQKQQNLKKAPSKRVKFQ